MPRQQQADDSPKQISRALQKSPRTPSYRDRPLPPNLWHRNITYFPSVILLLQIPLLPASPDGLALMLTIHYYIEISLYKTIQP